MSNIIGGLITIIVPSEGPGGFIIVPTNILTESGLDLLTESGNEIDIE